MTAGKRRESKATLHFAVGDIHGCYSELLDLECRLQRYAEKRKASAFFISVGDLVDRGPDSAKVVEHFRAGHSAGTHAVVMGNHEAMMLECVRELAPQNFRRAKITPPQLLRRWRERHADRIGFARFLPYSEFQTHMRLRWVGQGGATTLRSYGCDPSRPASWKIPTPALAFLATLPFVWRTEEALVTHALASRDDIETIEKQGAAGDAAGLQAALQAALWNRDRLRQRPDAKCIHVSGHTQAGRVKRLKSIACVQIDTGCVYGGRLSAYCIEHDRVISVPAQK